MPTRPFDYAFVRVVPRVERGEHINAGVIVYCPTGDFLDCRVHLHRDRLAALAPDAEPEVIERHLEAVVAVCRGDATGGPVAALPLRERFHWLVHPRSAILQVSDVHAGASDDLPATLDRLFQANVG